MVKQIKARRGRVAPLVGALSVCQKAVGSIPSQGTHLGFCWVPSRGPYERQLINVSLSHQSSSHSLSLSLSCSVSLPLPSSLSKINKHILGRGFKKGEREKKKHFQVSAPLQKDMRAWGQGHPVLPALPCPAPPVGPSGLPGLPAVTREALRLRDRGA